MKVGQTIFNMKNEDLKRNLSQKLLIAFNESKYHLEYQFICLRCIGITINPLYCKHCKYSYCGNCIQLLPTSKIICICRKIFKQNFEFQVNQELLNTYYFIQDKSSSQISQISYSEFLTWYNKNPYNFIPSENGDPTTKVIDEYNKKFQLTNLKVSRHQANYLHPFSLKEARLINFHFGKGYPLKLKDKVLCANDGNFLRAIHIVKIKLDWCHYNVDFSFALSKAIRSNKEKLKEITVNFLHYFAKSINYKSFLIICNALTFCSKLETIYLDSVAIKYFEVIQIPKSFYEFLSNSYILKRIVFYELAFYDYMNYKPFQRLVSLESLELDRCTLNLNSFEYMYQNNFPIMQKLFLSENQITNSFSSENIVRENPILHKVFKFPSILDLHLIDSFDSLETLLFNSLIKSKSIKLKSLEIYFSKRLDSKAIPPFFEFLKVSNIQFLSLGNLKETQGFDSDEFCEFLRNSKFLQGLKLTWSNGDGFNAGLILQALFLNKSIKVLYLWYMHLSNFVSDLINLILSNQVITILSLYECDIKIDLNFINALSKSKSVLYLDSSKNYINDDDAVKLSELSLKGINVDYTGLSESNEEMIYKKIPQFVEPIYIYNVRNLSLKKNQVN